MSLVVEYIRAFRNFQRNARLYLLSYALNGLAIGIILVLYNLYLDSLGYGTDFVGLILFAATIGIGIAIFPAGICVDRFSGKAILIWSSVAIGITATGQILFHQPIPLLISGFLAGLAGAFILVINAPFLTANSTPAERPHLFSLVIVLILATTVLGELLGGILPIWLRSIPWLMAPLPSWIDWILISNPLARSYQVALIIAGIIALPSFLPLLFMSDYRPARSSRSENPSQLRLRLHKLRWQRLSLRSLFLKPIFVLTLAQALIGMGAGTIIPYFNIYFVRYLGASTALFGLIDGTANALNALLTLLAPLLATRIGKVNTFTITRLVSVPLLLAIGFSPLTVAVVLYPLRQGLMDMANGLYQVFSMEIVPRSQRGLANSSYQAAFQVAWAAATPVGGLIIARIGYVPVFVTATILYLTAIFLVWGRFGRDTTSREIEEGAAVPPSVLELTPSKDQL
jgi:MFS family permease